MTFSGANQDSNRLYNNADSFAMAFDDAWRKNFTSVDENKSTKEEKLQIIFSKIKDHPFFKITYLAGNSSAGKNWNEHAEKFDE